LGELDNNWVDDEGGPGDLNLDEIELKSDLVLPVFEFSRDTFDRADEGMDALVTSESFDAKSLVSEGFNMLSELLLVVEGDVTSGGTLEVETERVLPNLNFSNLDCFSAFNDDEVGEITGDPVEGFFVVGGVFDAAGLIDGAAI
jgi:hypothetical protein